MEKERVLEVEALAGFRVRRVRDDAKIRKQINTLIVPYGYTRFTVSRCYVEALVID